MAVLSKVGPSGNSLVVQGLGFCASTAGSMGSIPGQRTRSRIS